MSENAQKPRIRFKGFSDAWEQRKLGEIGSVSMCRRIFKEQTSGTGDIPFYKIGTFGAKPDAFISRELFEEYKSKYPYPKKGDILISASGSIGRTVEFAGNNEYFQDSNIVWLSHDERLSNSFLKCFYSVVKWAGIEGSTIKRLYNDNILNTVICMPSVPEQERIGLFFENLDNLITLHQRKYDKLVAVKKSLLEKMFPADGETVPKIRFKGFSDAWEQRKVSELFRVTRGYVLAATQTETTKTDEKPYPVYSSQTKDKGLMGYYKDYLYEDAITWTTDGANAGTVNYRAGKFYCTNVCGVLLSNEVKANQMIAEALNSVTKGYVSYVGNPKLMNNVMADIVIQIPTQAEEREQLSSFFSKLDNLITLHQCKVFYKNIIFNNIKFGGLETENNTSWEQRKFEDAFIERREKTVTENEDTLLSCAINGMFLNSELFGHFRGTTTIGYLKVKKNDLILSAQNLHLGNANVNLRFEHGIISPAYKVYDLNYCEPEFVQAWVKKEDTKNFFLAATTEGASQCRKNIEWDTLGKQTICMPAIKEQATIGSFFKCVDNLITLHQRIKIFFTGDYHDKKNK